MARQNDPYVGIFIGLTHLDEIRGKTLIFKETY
jgi:hypothetical protein